MIFTLCITIDLREYDFYKVLFTCKVYNVNIVTHVQLKLD